MDRKRKHDTPITRVPEISFSDGFFPFLGSLVSGTRNFPLDKETAIYVTLLSTALWDYEEDTISVSMKSLGKTSLTKEDLDDIVKLLITKGWAYLSGDALVLARINNGRIKFPFSTAQQPQVVVGNTPAPNRLPKKVVTTQSSKSWKTTPELEEAKVWVEGRYDTWYNYLVTRKKTTLATSTLDKVDVCMTSAICGTLTGTKFIEYFYAMCAMHFEWVDSPKPPAKDHQSAKTLISSVDHVTLVAMVPFWLDNCQKIKKDITGDSLAGFAYFYNQLLTLRSKADSTSRRSTRTQNVTKL